MADGASMEPAISDGDGLIAVSTNRVKAGQRRVFEHPSRPGTWLVKRVQRVNDDGTMWVVSDNAEATLADSRTFGSLPAEGTYRVLLRIPARWIS